MNYLATTYVQCNRQVTLHFSGRDLYDFSLSGKSREGTDFFNVIGVWENHRVATGQDTRAWQEKSVESVRKAAIDLRTTMDSELDSFNQYLEKLIIFLDGADDGGVRIRHHYAWWYPKWFDMFRASL